MKSLCMSLSNRNGDWSARGCSLNALLIVAAVSLETADGVGKKFIYS